MVPPDAPGSRPGCTEIIFDAFSDYPCAFRSFCGVHFFLFFGGVRRFGWGCRTAISASRSSVIWFGATYLGTTYLAQNGSPKPVPRWLGRPRSCQKFIHRALWVSAMDAPFTVPLTGLRIMLSPPESMGCHCTTPGFWNGSALRNRPVYWIRVLVLGYTRCPVSRPLTLPANFTRTCAS